MTGPAIYFVSDTHLGDGSGADRFLYPDQLLELIARIDAEPGAHLVLLGDFMELWATSLDAVLVHYAPVFHALNRLAQTHPVTYVVGNHDCLPWYYFLGMGTGNVQVVEKFTAAGGRLVALHGHQYDPFNQIKEAIDGQIRAPFSQKLTRMVGLLGRIGGSKTGEAIQDLADWANAAAQSLESILHRESPGERGYPAEETRYDEAAIGLMRSGAQFVVMGHTHHPLTHIFGRRVYVNSGCWVWDRYPPTYARFAGGQLQLLSALDHLPYEKTPPER